MQLVEQVVGLREKVSLLTELFIKTWKMQSFVVISKLPWGISKYIYTLRTLNFSFPHNDDTITYILLHIKGRGWWAGFQDLC